MDNVGKTRCVMHLATINKTPHEVCLPAQTKSPFTPDKWPTTYRRDDTPNPSRIRKPLSKLLVSRSFASTKIDDFVGVMKPRHRSFTDINWRSFPTTAVLLDNDNFVFFGGSHAPRPPASYAYDDVVKWAYMWIETELEQQFKDSACWRLLIQRSSVTTVI